MTAALPRSPRMWFRSSTGRWIVSDWSGAEVHESRGEDAARAVYRALLAAQPAQQDNGTQSHAKPGDEAMVVKADAVEESGSRHAGGRTPAATSEAMDVTAGETAPLISARYWWATGGWMFALDSGIGFGPFQSFDAAVAARRGRS